MLGDLLNGFEKSRFILVTDTSKNSGRHLMLNLIESMLGRCDRLVLLCFERPVDYFKKWLHPTLAQKLICIDGAEACDKEGSEDYSLDSAVEAALKTQPSLTCVVMDSLSLPILSRPAPVTCSCLHRMYTADHIVQVAALVHRDVTDNHACSMLEHSASSVIDLLPTSLGSRQVCHIRHCRPTGKVFKTKECLEFDSSFHIENISPLKSALDAQPEPASQSQEPDPTVGLDLSFKLQLSNSEKEARSQVVLPYVKDGSTEEPTSKIIYEADDADDFDEEDPDDDLNI